MAELVDALVSNTNGASRAGSSPAQGTKISATRKKREPETKFQALSFCGLSFSLRFTSS